MKPSILAACAVLLPFLIAACDAKPQSPDASIATRSTNMKPSVTYLHLLKHTPFFTSLTTGQLRWVIAHSREWEVQSGTVIEQSNGNAHGTASEQGMWILLDGGWQIESAQRTYPADHASAGKWFSAAVTDQRWRLVTTEHSYVMKIERADFNAMLAQGFAFDQHLNAGYRYYSELFAAPADLVR
jgi:carbohydrate-selective porin OprB